MRKKTAEERFNTLARGWLAYLGLQLYNRPSAVALRHRPPSPKTPSAHRPPSSKPAHHHLIAQTARCEKTAEERFNMLARGWLAYPVTPMHSQLPPKSGCRNHIPRLANNLYNRSSAVDPSLYNQPQVGKPTWGYDYTTALRRLPHPSSAIPKNAIRPSVTILKTRPHHRFAPTAQCEKNRRRAVVETSSWQNRDTYFLSIARKAEPEGVGADRSANVTA